MGFDLDGTEFADGPVVEAAPSVVFGLFNETAGDWIAVDVHQFFDPFCVGEDVEVVIARLPELRAGAFQELRGFSLQDVERGLQDLVFRFAEEKVDVFGHKNISEDQELVTVTECFEGVEKDGAGVIVVEVGEAVVTTEGEEVMVAFGLVSLQTARHWTSLRSEMGTRM